MLDDLGTNLYSSIPAVLSEAVANAWDADATEVRIALDGSSDRITIRDTGVGMTRTDVKEKYLTVGYRRRERGASLTQLKRPVMGRKGIGKLSLFAIADTVEVRTKAAGEPAVGFRLHAPKIRKKAKARKPYHPPEIDPGEMLDAGTTITISGLRVRPGALTESALRKRLARRFGVIGERLNFRLWVDDSEITIEDRDDLPRLE